jgi:hypothetical protein
MLPISEGYNETHWTFSWKQRIRGESASWACNLGRFHFHLNSGETRIRQTKSIRDSFHDTSKPHPSDIASRAVSKIRKKWDGEAGSALEMYFLEFINPLSAHTNSWTRRKSAPFVQIHSLRTSKQPHVSCIHAHVLGIPLPYQISCDGRVKWEID